MKATIRAGFTAAHLALYNDAVKANLVISKATGKLNDVFTTYLRKQYDEVSPSFEQFNADRAALKSLALDRGLVDDQWVRKPYNLAVKALYGALPVSMTPAAVLKRASRPVADPEAKAKVGAKKGVVVDQPVVASCEQLVAKFGIAEVLKACTKILAADRTTALDAKTLEAIAGHFTAAKAAIQ
jgi:hypothetical protein